MVDAQGRNVCYMVNIYDAAGTLLLGYVLHDIPPLDPSFRVSKPVPLLRNVIAAQVAESCSPVERVEMVTIEAPGSVIYKTLVYLADAKEPGAERPE